MLLPSFGFCAEFIPPSPKAKLPARKESNHPFQSTTTHPARNVITKNVTQTDSSIIGIHIELMPNEGTLLVMTNGVGITIGFNGTFNITFTCSGNMPIDFSGDAVAPMHTGSFGGYVPQQTFTETSTGPSAARKSLATFVCSVGLTQQLAAEQNAKNQNGITRWRMSSMGVASDEICYSFPVKPIGMLVVCFDCSMRKPQ